MKGKIKSSDALPRRFERAGDLTDREQLESVLGPIAALKVETLQTTGFSGSAHRALVAVGGDGTVKRLVVKHISLQTDWTSRFSDSIRCREAALLAADPLAGVWNIIRSPYLAYFENDAEAVLLMEDLTPYLLPDIKKPLEEAQEELIVKTLARLHAGFWQSPLLALPWLARPFSYWSMLGPERTGQKVTKDLLPANMFQTLVRGWQRAFQLLPERVVRALSLGEEEVSHRWSHLPVTLVHGDVKVANFALRSNRQISAFDWSLTGAGPVSVDLGWYLAVNAKRLTGSKEAFQRNYRRLLETELGRLLDEKMWRDIVTVAILIGARMLLWSKAAALDSGDPASRMEWDWWANRLEEVC
jgi:hypothetical protein